MMIRLGYRLGCTIKTRNARDQQRDQFLLDTLVQGRFNLGFAQCKFLTSRRQEWRIVLATVSPPSL